MGNGQWLNRGRWQGGRPPEFLQPVELSPDAFAAANTSGWTIERSGGSLLVTRAMSLAAVDWDNATETGLILVYPLDLTNGIPFETHQAIVGSSAIIAQRDTGVSVGVGLILDAAYSAGRWAARFHSDGGAPETIEDRAHNLATGTVATSQAMIEGAQFLQAVDISPTLSSRQNGAIAHQSVKFGNFLNPSGEAVFGCLLFGADASLTTARSIEISDFRVGGLPTGIL